MKARRSELDSMVNLLLYSFRNGKNLPFTIPTKTCPDLKPSKRQKRKTCRKNHSEIVVESYLKGKKYRLLYYGMHTTKNVYKFDQDEEIVKQIIKKSLMKKKYGGKTLLEVRNIKKLLRKNDIQRTIVMTFRVSERERKSIMSKSKKRDLEISDYIRMKLFS